MAISSKTSRSWAQQKEALLARKARRAKTPMEFIEQILDFVARESGASRAVLYLFDEDAPSLNAIKQRHLELETQLELVATASWGFEDTAEILHLLFLTTKLRARAAGELKRKLPSLGFTSVETISFFSTESKIAGIIVIYANWSGQEMRRAKLNLRPVLNEVSIILDFVIDRFLQQELVGLNNFGLKTVSFDTRDGMCRIIEEARKLLGCEGVSFFVRDTLTDEEEFWLTAASPAPMPATPIGYTPKDDNLTARALSHKKPSIVHNVEEVRKRVSGLQRPKWCELPKYSADRCVMFVPVVRGENIVALLRCSNKMKVAGEALFNRLDVRRAEVFAGLLHTWQSAVENESRFTSSLLDVAHELRLSSSGIKARAEYVDVVLTRRDMNYDLVHKKLVDIVDNMDSILEMMALVVTIPGADNTASRSSVPFKPYGDLCVPVVESYRPKAKERSLTFEYTYKYQMGLIYADRKDFLLILHNMIGNAVKYTHLGKMIFIYLEAARRNARYATISVASEGLLIRPDEREQIFRFRYRAKAAKESTAEGQGRGLAIARGKARRFKGDLVYSFVQNMNVFSLLIPKHLFVPPP